MTEEEKREIAETVIKVRDLGYSQLNILSGPLSQKEKIAFIPSTTKELYKCIKLLSDGALFHLGFIDWQEGTPNAGRPLVRDKKLKKIY